MKIKWMSEMPLKAELKKRNQLKRWLIYTPIFSINLTFIMALLGYLGQTPTYIMLVLGGALIFMLDREFTPSINKSDKTFLKVSVIYFIYQVMLFFSIYTAFLIGTLCSDIGNIFDLFETSERNIRLFIYGTLTIFFICTMTQMFLSKLIKYYDPLPELSETNKIAK